MNASALIGASSSQSSLLPLQAPPHPLSAICDCSTRKVQQIPDYFTPEEAAALVEGAPSYPTRMAFRIMLKTGLRVFEALTPARGPALGPGPADHRGADRLAGEQGAQGAGGPGAGRLSREPARPGVIPQQGSSTADAGHVKMAPEPGQDDCKVTSNPTWRVCLTIGSLDRHPWTSSGDKLRMRV